MSWVARLCRIMSSLMLDLCDKRPWRIYCLSVFPPSFCSLCSILSNEVTVGAIESALLSIRYLLVTLYCISYPLTVSTACIAMNFEKIVMLFDPGNSLGVMDHVTMYLLQVLVWLRQLSLTLEACALIWRTI